MKKCRSAKPGSKACDMKEISTNASQLLNRINAVQECDATVAE